MATFRKRGKSIRAEVYKQGERRSDQYVDGGVHLEFEQMAKASFFIARDPGRAV